MQDAEAAVPVGVLGIRRKAMRPNGTPQVALYGKSGSAKT